MERLNYSAKRIYARYMGQLSVFNKGIAAANASDWAEYTRINRAAMRPGPPLPISAIMRVKNGQTTLMVSVEAVLNYCKEVILIDHNSTDKTWEIMEAFTDKYPDRVKAYKYEKPTARSGVGYLERVNKGEGSLAEYYNFCFSKGTEDYLLKWDVYNLALPPFYKYFGEGIRKGRDIVYFDGFDVAGLFSCTNEGRLFKRSLNWEFQDFDYCEGLVIDGRPLKEAGISRYSAPVPAFFHLRHFSINY